MNSVARNAEGHPAFHVLRLLDADRIETTKGGRDERTKTLEPRFGPLRQTGVDQRERNPSITRFRGEVRPDLRFDYHNPDRIDCGKGPAHDRPEIERAIENFHPLVRFRVRDLESGRGGSGEHAKKIRIELAELGRQLQRDRDFADAHGVDPGAAVRSESGPRFCVITAEALSQLVPVISAPDQLRDLPRKKEEQTERIKKIVEKSDHERTRASAATPVRCRNNTSVAPYFFARVTSQNADGGIFSAGRFSRTKNPDPSSIPASSVLSSKS